MMVSKLKDQMAVLLVLVHVLGLWAARIPRSIVDILRADGEGVVWAEVGGRRGTWTAVAGCRRSSGPPTRAITR